jgi:hypothetical protein
MSEFRENLAVAIVSVVVGGLIGFGSAFFLQSEEATTAREESARLWSLEFLQEEYSARKESYIEIKAALQQVAASGDSESIEELNDAIRMMPILEPRFPTNNALIQLGEEFSRRLAEISSDPEAVRKFVSEETAKYVCIMDVNLSAIERLLQVLSTADELQRIHNESDQEELEFFGRSCFEDQYKFNTPD